MIRSTVVVACLLALAACNSTPNDVAEGVGFQDYAAYEARRAQLRSGATAPVTVAPPASLAVAPPAVVQVATPVQSALPSPAPVSVAAAQPADPITTRAAAAIAAAEQASVAPPAPVLGIAAPVAAPAPTILPTNLSLASASNPGISDEQDFDAVAARETILSDAERRERMQDQLVIVQPTAMPARNGSTPNIIDYALSTTHAVGERAFTRNPFGQGRHERNCRAFRSHDLAQEAFLEQGGPIRDRQGLDPDGDGFACAWNPDIYRAAARAASN